MSAEYIDKNRLILWMNDWMLQNAPVDERDDTTRADTILDAIRMVEDSPAADVRENVIRTQADKFRAMPDKELATHFALKQPCPHDRFCGDYDCKSFEDCHDCWLDWLKSPVEVEDGDPD